MNRIIKNPASRRYMYVIGVSLSALLIGYGIITSEEGGLWLSLLGAVLGLNEVVASVNTPGKDSSEQEDEITFNTDDIV